MPTRRGVLQAIVTGAILPMARPIGFAGRTIRLGGPIFLKSDDPGEPPESIGGWAIGLLIAQRLRPTYGTRCGHPKGFAAEDVIISEVGAWKNLPDPDSRKRSENFRYVLERLQLAEAVGARCCVDIAGSFNRTLWYGPDPRNLSREFFDVTVENCRKLIDEVKPKSTKFSIEMMPWNLPDGPDAYLKLLRAVDRPAFGVHMDVCNVIDSPTRFYHNSEVVSECFRKLGRWILSCHAKDLQWMAEYNVHFKKWYLGGGQIDYKTYLTQLSSLPQDVPLMMEHLKLPEEYKEGSEYIRRMGREAGVTIL